MFNYLDDDRDNVKLCVVEVLILLYLLCYKEYGVLSSKFLQLTTLEMCVYVYNAKSVFIV